MGPKRDCARNSYTTTICVCSRYSLIFLIAAVKEQQLRVQSCRIIAFVGEVADLFEHFTWLSVFPSYVSMFCHMLLARSYTGLSHYTLLMAFACSRPHGARVQQYTLGMRPELPRVTKRFAGSGQFHQLKAEAHQPCNMTILADDREVFKNHFEVGRMLLRGSLS